MKICFQEPDNDSWFANKKCTKKTLNSADLKYMDRGNIDDEAAENQKKSGYSRRVNFLSAGTHEWGTRLQIPRKNFVFKSGTCIICKHAWQLALSDY